jgi:hypothetical protein
LEFRFPLAVCHWVGLQMMQSASFAAPLIPPESPADFGTAKAEVAVMQMQMALIANA